MPTFTYSARPASGGEMQQGEVDLPSKDEVHAHLHRQKLIPVSVREKPKEISFTFGTGVTTRDIVIRCLNSCLFPIFGLYLMCAIAITKVMCTITKMDT